MARVAEGQRIYIWFDLSLTTHTIARAPITNLDWVHRRTQADHAQRVVRRALHLCLALRPHGARQPLPLCVLRLGRHRRDARGLVGLPVAALALFAAVECDLALRAPAQRGGAALRLAEEAAEEVDPKDGLGAGLFGLAELLLLRCRLVVVAAGVLDARRW